MTWHPSPLSASAVTVTSRPALQLGVSATQESQEIYFIYSHKSSLSQARSYRRLFQEASSLDILVRTTSGIISAGVIMVKRFNKSRMVYTRSHILLHSKVKEHRVHSRPYYLQNLYTSLWNAIKRKDINNPPHTPHSPLSTSLGGLWGIGGFWGGCKFGVF